MLMKYSFSKVLDEIRIVGTPVALSSHQTQTRKGKKMRRDGQTIRGYEMDMGRVKSWAKRTFSRERIAEATARLVVAGYAGIVLAQVFQTY